MPTTDSGRATRPQSSRLVSRLLGSRPVTRVARLATHGRLPVLAYHDVPDERSFAAHLDLIQDSFTPVAGVDVARAVVSGTSLPRGAIWVTFDDAHPGVLANALPLLEARSVPATMFVCPGVIDCERPFWWQLIELALSNGQAIPLEGISWRTQSVVTRLKQVPDPVRRETVARVEEELENAGLSRVVVQTTTSALRLWLDAGLDLGNHTWDHPCLDTCSVEEQRRQITEADAWLRDLTGRRPQLFAYPNGNTAAASRRLLAEHGYAVTALFDHRVATLRSPEVSRLRIDARASVARLRAISSGAHPAAFAVARGLGLAANNTGVQQ